MNKRKKISKRKISGGSVVKCAIVLLLLFVFAGYYLLFTGMAHAGKKTYLYIDDDDTVDSVYAKLRPLSTAHSYWSFRQLGRFLPFEKKLRAGRYEIGDEGALMTLRHLRNGFQAPVKLTINSVRTIEQLSKYVGGKMMFGEEGMLDAVKDKTVCRQYGYTPETIIAMFPPNTYELYWNTSITKFLDKMNRENKKFWTPERREKAKAAGLSPVQVMTLASIVDEETSNIEEMPMIAGMYINRLNTDMLLQADPTVKFATKQFEARRIYNKMLQVDSPYNTYKYKGLPPGPIRLPSVSAIDAVLDYAHHDYMYMCAKEDLSGTHNFARTFEKHLENAEKYAKALNERGIK